LEKLSHAGGSVLSSTSTTAALAPSSVVTVLDRNHTILLRLPDGERWVGKKAPGGAATDRIRRGAADDVRVDFGVDGIRRLWTTVPIDPGGTPLQLDRFAHR
jgi:hypothetical protein